MTNLPTVHNAPDSHESNIREMSAVLSTFPWATDFLVQDVKTLLRNQDYTAYVESIAQLETDVDSSSEDVDASRLRWALARVAPESVSLPAPPVLKRPLPHRLCEIICAYRLLDVLYDLQEKDTLLPFGNPLYAKQRLSTLLPTKIWPLEDWVLLLRNAKGKIQSLDDYEASLPTNEDSALIVRYPAGSMPTKLLKDLFALTKNRDALKILSNVVMAALHLACMFRGTADRDERLAVPNLPSEPERWNAEATLTDEESAFLQDIIRTSEIQKIRHALYGALLFSPLYLLTHRKLTGNAWDQEKMLKLSKSLGNNKPAIILKIERLLWETLLAIATGKDGAYTAMLSFFSKVDWNEIAMVSEIDRAHFADDKSLPAPSCHLVSFEGETGLPESWPLAKFRLKPREPTPGPSDENQQVAAAPTPSLSSSDEQEAMDVDASGAGAADANNDASSAQSKFRSQRLRDLDATGKLKSAASKDTKAPPRHRPKKSARVETSHRSMPLHFVPFQEIEKGVFIQQVRVKRIKKQKITFNEKAARTRVRGDEILIYEPSGQLHRWTPEFHFQSDLDTFNKLHKLVEENYVNNQPRYMSQPDTSHIRVLSYADYKAMSVQAIQSLLRDYHIAITGFPTQNIVEADHVDFDETGLQLLTNLEAPIEFQDQSIPVGDDHSVQICTGTLEHILGSTRQGGAILNALSFPLPLSEIRKSAFSSDVEAWRLTEGLPYCDHDALYPTADVRWGLAATAGGRHWIHIDCDGLCTVIDTVCGGKLWLLFTPGEQLSEEIFGDIDQFFNGFDVTNPPHYWLVEAVYLRPGTRLIMKANTPHAVFTTEHCIAVGGHFYSFSNMQQTMFGLVHAFIMDTLVTNTEHPKTRVLLFRMLQYLYKFTVQGANPKKNCAFHLPDLTDIDAFIDVLTLCNYAILSNVLDPRTYNFPDLQYGHTANSTHLLQRQRHDYNALSPDDRHYFSYVRGLAVNLIHWLNCHFIFEGIGKEWALTSARRYLHHQVRAIVRYKANAETENVQGVPNCTERDLRRQISLLFEDGMADFRGLSLTDLSDADGLAWETGLVPAQRAQPLDFQERDPLELGTTKGDKMFHAGSAQGFPLSQDNIRDARLDVNNEMDQEDEVGGSDMDQDVSDNAKGGNGDEEEKAPDGDESAHDEDGGFAEQGGDDDEEESDDGESNNTPETSDMEYENWERKARR